MAGEQAQLAEQRHGLRAEGHDVWPPALHAGSRDPQRRLAFDRISWTPWRRRSRADGLLCPRFFGAARWSAGRVRASSIGAPVLASCSGGRRDGGDEGAEAPRALIPPRQKVPRGIPPRLRRWRAVRGEWSSAAAGTGKRRPPSRLRRYGGQPSRAARMARPANRSRERSEPLTWPANRSSRVTRGPTFALVNTQRYGGQPSPDSRAKVGGGGGSRTRVRRHIPAELYVRVRSCNLTARLEERREKPDSQSRCVSPPPAETPGGGQPSEWRVVPGRGRSGATRRR
jgi:hypothetical protein